MRFCEAQIFWITSRLYEYSFHCWIYLCCIGFLFWTPGLSLRIAMGSGKTLSRTRSNSRPWSFGGDLQPRLWCAPCMKDVAGRERRRWRQAAKSSAVSATGSSTVTREVPEITAADTDGIIVEMEAQLRNVEAQRYVTQNFHAVVVSEVDALRMEVDFKLFGVASEDVSVLWTYFNSLLEVLSRYRVTVMWIDSNFNHVLARPETLARTICDEEGARGSRAAVPYLWRAKDIGSGHPKRENDHHYDSNSSLASDSSSLQQAYVALPQFIHGKAENQFNSLRRSPRLSDRGVTCFPEAVQYLIRSYAAINDNGSINTSFFLSGRSENRAGSSQCTMVLPIRRKTFQLRSGSSYPCQVPALSFMHPIQQGFFQMAVTIRQKLHIQGVAVCRSF